MKKKNPIRPSQIDRPELDDYRVKLTRNKRQARAWAGLFERAIIGAQQESGNMATAKKAATAKAVKLPKGWEAGKEVTDGEWFKFGEPGTAIIGRVQRAEGPSENIRTGLIRLTDVAGATWAVGLGGNLQSILKDRADLKGSVVGIMFESQDDPDPSKTDAAGEPYSGMKHYRVIDFGRDFPEFAEPAESLPF